MRPCRPICNVLINGVIGCLDHVSDQILRLSLAQLAEARQALGIVLNLLFETLAHLHAHLIRV